jgi:Asp-tRNA(Asn)/Glu-tRNA(Gln) amidotransferase A subunit family amidase
MTDQELAFASIAALAPRLAAREISPVELTEAALARLEQLEPKLNAFITVTGESARHAARAAEAAIQAGHYQGPLHGIPVAIKDLFATRGVVTTFGSPLYADWVPDFDAAAVEQLKRAGAVLLGKTNLHELAYGSTSANVHYGAVHNPWRLDHHRGARAVARQRRSPPASPMAPWAATPAPRSASRRRVPVSSASSRPSAASASSAPCRSPGRRTTPAR